MLDITTYDRTEARARARLSMREAQAFAPATFEDENYPVRVHEEASLLRYVDTMHETFEGKFFEPALYRYTRAEGQLLAGVAERVARLTEEQFGRCVRPWMAPFGAMPAFRVLNAFCERTQLESPRILEIGPGSGYLGALLLLAGQRYASMDNTQGFYLWQNRLFEAMAPGELSELAEREDWSAHYAESRAAHLAWWQWASMGNQPPIEADIVVCDHALGEMHPLALRFVLRQVRRILAGDGPRLFFFTSPGKEHFSDLNTIGRACMQSGLRLLTFESFFGFTTPESSLADCSTSPDHAFKTRLRYRLKRVVSPIRSKLAGTALEDLDHVIPLWNQAPGEETVGAAEILPVRAEEEPLDYRFLTAAGFRSPLDVVRQLAGRAS